MDSSSSSWVVAPLYRPEMVRVATRIGSTACRPSQQRCTARTILFRSTSSVVPLRLVTLMAVAVGGEVSRNSLSLSIAALVSVLTAFSSWRDLGWYSGVCLAGAGTDAEMLRVDYRRRRSRDPGRQACGRFPCVTGPLPPENPATGTTRCTSCGCQ